jgi:ribonuclease PH
MRHDGRAPDALRPIEITRNFTQAPAGSVLWRQGGTVALCTASITPGIPPWFKPDKPGGWLTADYVMLPGSTPMRKDWPKIGHTDSRGTEIQRLIGRSVRGILDLSKIGPHTIHLDCQILQADGGTRTASICGAYVALVDAIRRLPKTLKPSDRPGDDPKFYDPPAALTGELSAVSVGIVDGEARLDLDYHDDSRAQVDLNVAMTSAGQIIELQGSGENGGSFDRTRLIEMLDLATSGCHQIVKLQRQALG